MNRRPAVAGLFYPATHKELSSELEQLFSKAKPAQKGDVAALIVPHAGYVFSGGVAASAFNQLDGFREYKRIFVIGSAHKNSFSGASVYCSGNFEMPYGVDTVDIAVCKSLCDNYPSLFSCDPAHHSGEHSIEVQLPFLNFTVSPGYSIVPVLIGEAEPKDCKAIASALAPWFNGENLFVISSDFSHYPDYEDACEVDNDTMEAIVSGSPERLLQVLDSNASRKVRDLYTSLCGWSSVLVLMNLTKEAVYTQGISAGVWHYSYNALEYQNSGDNVSYGERERVVGYWAIAVVRDEIRLFREIARRAVELSVVDSNDRDLDSIAKELLDKYGFSRMPESLMQECGVFVTLKKKGELRGCIGYTESKKPLYKEIANVARLAALQDYRFERVLPEELPLLEYEVSVLSPMQLIRDVSEIKLGTHGILVRKGSRSGLFLPQVATETEWTLEQYLGHCSRDKAGIGWDGWKDADVYVFTVHTFPR